MNPEELIEVGRVGRRCSVCQSGRGWRRFELVRRAGREPVVLCGSCRARFGDDPPTARNSMPTLEPAEPVSSATRRANVPRPEPEDRLRAALRNMPSSFSTATAARAAGVNKKKALARLHQLERGGEVYRAGNRWSIQPPPSDVALAMDRLQARTSNLRIVRDRPGVG